MRVDYVCVDCVCVCDVLCNGNTRGDCGGVMCSVCRFIVCEVVCVVPIVCFVLFMCRLCVYKLLCVCTDCVYVCMRIDYVCVCVCVWWVFVYVCVCVCVCVTVARIVYV